ncbi:MAG: hypothetical protein LBC64_09250 [Fibromonadaceae bacterium]|jgi:hypothetical protein|nr:hypothetical protein [Fibromonadaceae bacterium]
MKKKIVAVAFAVALASTAFAYSKMKASKDECQNLNNEALQALCYGGIGGKRYEDTNTKCPYDSPIKCYVLGLPLH